MLSVAAPPSLISSPLRHPPQHFSSATYLHQWWRGCPTQPDRRHSLGGGTCSAPLQTVVIGCPAVQQWSRLGWSFVWWDPPHHRLSQSDRIVREAILYCTQYAKVENAKHTHIYKECVACSSGWSSSWNSEQIARHIDEVSVLLGNRRWIQVI